MFEKLDHIETKYRELTDALSSPEVMADSSKYQKTAKAHAEIAELYEKYREYKDLKRGIAESKEMVASETDAELREYAQQELGQL
jgi:peptide chain release factor 1